MTQPASKHQREQERLNALKNLNILDTLPEHEYDQIVQLASYISGKPIALISLVDENRQWFKAKIGIEAEETPRDIAFCAHAILGNEPFVVENAENDERFKHNPLVTGPAQFKFYAGLPISAPGSELPIGTLCVIDTSASKLNSDQLKALEALKDQVENLLRLRSQIQELSIKKEQIRELSERQEYILEGAGLGAWDWWLDNNRVYFDARWCEMLGLNFSDVQHHLSTWESRVHPEDIAGAYGDIESYLAGKTEYYENIHRMRHQNGQWVWILDRGRISERDENGKPLRFTGTHLDITELKKNEQLFSEMQNLTKTGGWQLDFESEEIVWTDQTYKITETAKSQKLTIAQALCLHTPEGQNQVRDKLVKCRSGQIFELDLELMTAKQQKKWVFIKGIPIFNALGKVTQAIGILQDITLQKAQALELDQILLQASHASKMASLGELSAGVAHEINNPLAIAHGALTALEKHLEDESPLRKQTDLLKTGISRIAKIVRGLRRFSRTESKSDRKTFDLLEIVQNSLIFVETKKREIGAMLELQAPEQPVFVEVNGPEIEQILINLVQNALDAVRDKKDKSVTLKWGLSASQRAFVVVQDSGSGVPEAVRAQIFQPFFTTKAVGKGTGLGLSISKGIAQDHQGDLRLATEISPACFELTLPSKATG